MATTAPPTPRQRRLLLPLVRGPVSAEDAGRITPIPRAFLAEPPAVYRLVPTYPLHGYELTEKGRLRLRRTLRLTELKVVSYGENPDRLEREAGGPEALADIFAFAGLPDLEGGAA